ncbi:WD40-repeat-containing domain protein [Scleroderma yunnanense]
MTTIWNTVKDTFGGRARQDPARHPGPSPEPVIILAGHTDAVNSLAYHPSGKLISGCHDRTVRMWDMRDPGQAARIMEHEEDVRSLVVAENGRAIVSGTSGGRIIVWDAETCEKALEIKKPHSYPVVSLAISRDSQQVASVSMDGVVMVSSLTSGKTVAGPFDGYDKWPISFAFSPDGSQLACGATDHSVHIRDSFAGGELARLTQHASDRVWSMVWSPDSSRLIFGLHNGNLEFFDMNSGNQLKECRAHSQRVHTLAISTDGRLLTSASTDRGTIKLWDTSTYQQVGPVLSHTDLVHSLAISPDGKYLASAGNDKKIKIWDLGAVFALPMDGNNGGDNNVPKDDDRPSNDGGNTPEGDNPSLHVTQPDAQSRDPDQNSETSAHPGYLDLSAVPAPPDEATSDTNDLFWEPSADLDMDGNTNKRGSDHLFQRWKPLRDRRKDSGHLDSTSKKYFNVRRVHGNNNGADSTRNPQDMARGGQSDAVHPARGRRVLAVASNDQPECQEQRHYLIRNNELVRLSSTDISDSHAFTSQSRKLHGGGNLPQVISDNDSDVANYCCYSFMCRIQPRRARECITTTRAR